MSLPKRCSTRSSATARTRFRAAPCSTSPIRISFSRSSSPTTSSATHFHWPDIDRYVDLNGARTRKQYTLWDRRVEAGDPERTALWRTVSDALSAPEIEAALRERLQKGLEIRAKGSGESWPVPMYPQPVLYADFDGYAIKPHPDTRRKVLTMLIYMPEDESQRELGTTVYKISPMGVFAWKSYGLVKDKTAPFLPNTGFAFVVIHPTHNLLHTSWHGRDTISIDNRQAPDDDPQHLLRQAAEGGRGRERVSVRAVCLTDLKPPSPVCPSRRGFVVRASGRDRR